MKLRINPFNRGNPMTLTDAAVLSLIMAFVFWVVTFFAGLTIMQIRADPAEVLLQATQNFVIAWVTNFVTFAGLEQYIKRRGEKHE